jgi:hypothetical protein
MKPQDIFGIIVRTLGLSLLFYALWYLAYGLASVAGYEAGDASDLRAYFLTGGIQLFAGFYLLRGAPGLMNIAYPASREETPSESDSPEDW